ncbi:hypothetical protein C3F09_11610 [candidate division GN15 bacterium]|uniref:Sigma-54 factor interaction domain-containing protein n=1 Tax=candidate division GN15 bacterium TaxID=2072418 RepID=A0A855WV31_9BACT|nr:MAG: hypothetical protein C3F09_11610 [candidate division GN15 bacterium]
MKNDNIDNRGFCDSIAHFMATLRDKRDFTAIVRQYEANRTLLEEAGGGSAGAVVHLAAQAYASLHQNAAALRTARLAHTMAAAEGDTTLLAEIFLTLGGILRDLGEFKGAEKAFRDAESIFRRNDCSEGQSRALNHLGGLFFRQKDYRNALGCLMDAVEIARTLGDKKKLAFMMGNIGRIHAFTGDLAQAEKHLNLNVELSSELGDQLETARAYLSLGYLYIQQAEYAKAEDALDHAYPLIVAEQSRRDEVIYLTYRGELQYRSGRYPDSERSLNRALALAEKIASGSTLAARVMRHLAELTVRTQQYRQAQRFAAKALAIYGKAEDKVEIGALMKLNGQIAEATGQNARAVEAYTSAITTLSEADVRWEKADALKAAASSKLFSNRERMTFLFRAEELYVASKITTLRDEVSRMIQGLDSAVGESQPAVAAAAAKCDYLTVNPTIRQFLSQLPVLGRSDLAILLTGETGVGKDQLARYYHSIVRPSGPFVAINCASLPETLLESELFGYLKGAFTGADSNKPGLLVSANGGVLMLDEIGDMPLALQAKLLRVIERRAVVPLGGTSEVPIDIKLVAATNRDLEKMVVNGTFRRDLYYRLSGITFHIPALRERKEDIALLLHHYMTERGLLDNGAKLPAELVHQFVEYDWPGNVRELVNKVKRLEIMAQMVVEGDLVELARSVFAGDKLSAGKTGGTLFNRVIEFERMLILEALMAAHGNKCEAARLLGVHEATVRTKLKRYGITLPYGAPN